MGEEAGDKIIPWRDKFVGVTSGGNNSAGMPEVVAGGGRYERSGGCGAAMVAPPPSNVLPVATNEIAELGGMTPNWANQPGSDINLIGDEYNNNEMQLMLMKIIIITKLIMIINLY